MEKLPNEYLQWVEEKNATVIIFTRYYNIFLTETKMLNIFHELFLLIISSYFYLDSKIAKVESEHRDRSWKWNRNLETSKSICKHVKFNRVLMKHIFLRSRAWKQHTLADAEALY